MVSGQKGRILYNPLTLVGRKEVGRPREGEEEKREGKEGKSERSHRTFGRQTECRLHHRRKGKKKEKEREGVPAIYSVVLFS